MPARPSSVEDTLARGARRWNVGPQLLPLLFCYPFRRQNGSSPVTCLTVSAWASARDLSSVM